MPESAPAGPYRIHRLIQDMLRDPGAARDFLDDPQPTFARYGVSDAEAEMLESGTVEAMTALGVHPNLQMKYLRLRKPLPPPGASGPLDAYLDRLREG